jgi:hypothetical protein
MPLNVTPVNRNLQTRVMFMGLEFEDLFVVLGIAALTNVGGHFVSGEIAGLPLSIVVQYGIPLSIVPLLMLFKYGRPRGYIRDQGRSCPCVASQPSQNGSPRLRETSPLDRCDNTRPFDKGRI